MNLNPVDIAEVLGLESVSFHDHITGVSFDSRLTQPGDLFFALKSESGDGHIYAKQALQHGAVAVVCERIIEDIDTHAQVMTLCSLTALEKVGVYCRSKSTSLNIAITGSVGKTTTKELLAHILRHFGDTVASQGTFNNHIGVPYSLCQLTPTTKYGVFEAGMDNPGEIAPLSHLIQPEVSIITSIAPSHIGHMGSIEAIAMEKGDIVAGLSSNGLVILPLDTPQHEILLGKARAHGTSRIATFGKGAHADARLLSYTPTPNGQGSDISISLKGKTYTFPLNFPGEHSALNATLAFLVCTEIGLKPEEVISAISSFEPIQGRGQRLSLIVDNKNITLIDDAYNANPTSLKAGLSVLNTTPTQDQGRRIAVLGDMLSLGERSADYHRSMGLLIKDMDIDLVFAAGPEMLHLFEALDTQQQGDYKLSAEEVIPTLRAHLKAGDVVFVKGSKGSYISRVVDALKKEGVAA